MIGTVDIATRATRPLGRDLALAALGVAGVALGVLGELGYARTGASPVAVGRDLFIGWAFIGGGLLAWQRWPHHYRCCALVVAQGFAWFMPDLRGLGDPVLFTIGTVFSPFSDMILIHLVIAFPSGRLGPGWRRTAVLSGYAVATVAGIVYALIDDPAVDRSPFACDLCRQSALLASPGPWPFWTVTLFGAVSAVLEAAAAVVLVVHRWAVSTPVARRLGAARWAAWTCCATMLATDGVRIMPVPLTASGQDVLDWVGGLSQLAIPLVLGLGAARAHAAGAAVGEVLAEFEHPASPARIGEMLARALGDPSLRFLVWRPETSEYVDATGRVVAPRASGDRRVTRVTADAGQPLAAIIHDRAFEDVPDLVEAVRVAVRLGLENEQFRAQLEARLKEVSESRARIVEAADVARRQTERDLHDGAQRRLLALGLLLEGLEPRLRDHPDEDVIAGVTEARAELRAALEELRELARGLHPAILSQAGLAAALPSLAERSPLDVEVVVRCGRCLPSMETAVYLVASECLANVARHARARRATICVELRDGRLRLEVTDDGVGGADPARGSGMRGMADRVSALGGTISVHSPPGIGTRVLVDLPCE